MSESSAAGYQLRRHYQRYLLALECLETGRNANDAVAFAEKLKKKKRCEKDSLPQQYPGPGFVNFFLKGSRLKHLKNLKEWFVFFLDVL